MNELITLRDKIAVSIKHTGYGWKLGKPLVMWGYHHTEDGEKRCFSGYTEDFTKAERYNLGDFEAHGYGSYIKDDHEVPLDSRFCKTWKDYDTVLVREAEIRNYYRLCDLIKEEQT